MSPVAQATVFHGLSPPAFFTVMGEFPPMNSSNTDALDQPIDGTIIDYNFVDHRHVIFDVEKDGELHKETYEFVSREQV